ncbi:hypothetical protein F5884DRAFT_806352 [Xylogone sp. PMI_703]|nr:hypothetical protein F5884DRAFT_806352 [Xylogone sp. PMI_703]
MHLSSFSLLSFLALALAVEAKLHGIEYATAPPPRQLIDSDALSKRASSQALGTTGPNWVGYSASFDVKSHPNQCLVLQGPPLTVGLRSFTPPSGVQCVLYNDFHCTEKLDIPAIEFPGVTSLGGAKVVSMKCA